MCVCVSTGSRSSEEWSDQAVGDQRPGGEDEGGTVGPGARAQTEIHRRQCPHEEDLCGPGES